MVFKKSGLGLDLAGLGLKKISGNLVILLHHCLTPKFSSMCGSRDKALL